MNIANHDQGIQLDPAQRAKASIPMMRSPLTERLAASGWFWGGAWDRDWQVAVASAVRTVSTNGNSVLTFENPRSRFRPQAAGKPTSDSIALDVPLYHARLVMGALFSIVIIPLNGPSDATGPVTRTRLTPIPSP